MKNTSSGNRVLLKIRGQIIGVCGNVDVQDDFNLQEADGIGSMEVQEFVPGKLTYTISGEKMVVAADILTALGLVPRSDDWLLSPELEVEIIDTVSSKTVEHYTGCKFASHSRRYGKHVITSESFQIRARHKDV